MREYIQPKIKHKKLRGNFKNDTHSAISHLVYYRVKLCNERCMDEYEALRISRNTFGTGRISVRRADSPERFNDNPYRTISNITAGPLIQINNCYIG